MGLRLIDATIIRKAVTTGGLIVYEGSTVTIRNSAGNLAVLYADQAASSTLTNPFVADDSGTFEAWVLPDVYAVGIVNGALSDTVYVDIDQSSLNGTGHINDYLNTAPDHQTALVNACNSVHTLYFGNETLELTGDFTYPSGGVCRVWELQNCTINLRDSLSAAAYEGGAAQILITEDIPFTIRGNGATVNGNWAVATLTAKTAQQPTTLTVDDSSLFSVNQIVSTDFAQRYMANSAVRAALSGNGDFNKVSSIPDANTIVLDYSVDQTSAFDVEAGEANILPGGCTVINCRFDKRGISYQGSKHFHISGVTFNNMPNAFALEVNDTTEQATAEWLNIEINGVALDAIRFRGERLKIRNFKLTDVRDVSKQSLVWSNATKNGYLDAELLDFEPDNQDAFLFSENGFLPHRTIRNSKFNGRNSASFTPPQSKQFNCYNFEGRTNSLDYVNAGTAHYDNIVATNITRGFLGTTFINTKDWLQDNATFTNCKLPCDGVYYQPSGAGTFDIKPITYQGTTLKGSTFKMSRGCSEVAYYNSVLMEDWPVDGDEFFEDGTTTSIDYEPGQRIIDSQTGIRYTCDTESTASDLLTDTDYFTSEGNIYYVEQGHETTRSYLRDDYIEVQHYEETSNTTTRAYRSSDKIHQTTSGIYYQTKRKTSDNSLPPSGTPLTNTDYFDVVTYLDVRKYQGVIGGGAQYTAAAGVDISGNIVTEDYQVNNSGGYPIGTSVINIDTGTVLIDDGDQVSFDDGVTVYDLVSVTGNPATQITLDGTLSIAVSDNDTMVVYRDMFESIQTAIDRGHFDNTKIVGDFDIEANDNIKFDNVILPNRVNNTKIEFDEEFHEGIDNKMILQGADNTDTTLIDPAQWFTCASVESDVPNIVFEIEDTEAVGEYGGDQATTREMKWINLKSRRFESSVGSTAPLPMRGAFLVDPLEGSLVRATKTPEFKRVTTTALATIDASAAKDATSIDYTSFAASEVPNPGDWITINVAGSSMVYFHEITAVSGSSPYTLTISPGLNVAVTTSDKSYLCKTDYLLLSENKSIQVLGDSGTTVSHNNDLSWSNTVNFNTEHINNLTYSSLSSNQVTLPRGRYTFNFTGRFKDHSGGSAIANLKVSARLQSDLSGWTTIKSCAFEAGGSTSDNGVLAVSVSFGGEFTLDDEANMYIQIYPSVPVECVGGSSDQPFSSLIFTRIG